MRHQSRTEVGFGAAAIAALVAAILLSATPALACSLAAPADMDELIATGTARELPDRPVLAVYEQRHIAWTPSLLLRTERSASIVTRYWGDVEPPLGARVHGEGFVALLGFDECGNSASANGHVEYEVLLSAEPDSGRSGFWTDTADLTLDQIRRGLTDRFGEPTAVSTGLDDFVAAYALLLWSPALFIAAIVLLVFAAKRWRHTDRVYAFSLPSAVVGAVGVVIASLSSADFGGTDRVLLLLAFGVAIGAGRLLGPLLGVVSGAIAAAGLYSHGPNAFDSGDAVIAIGLAAMITGAGHLVWRLRHWSRYAGTFGVGAGVLMIAARWLWQRGATSEPLVLVGAGVVGVIAVTVVWWVTLREVPSGGDSAPDTIGV